MLKAVIFDMDGVIIDSHSVAYQLLCACANSFGCNVTVSQIKKWGSLSSRQFWEKIKADYDLPHSIDYLRNSYDTQKEIDRYKGMDPIPGITELLRELQSSPLQSALATSASAKRMQAVLTLFRFAPFFNQCVCDDEVKHSKPHPHIFLLASQKLGVHPNECVVIEDSENGVSAAKKAGMKCIGFTGLSHVNENMQGADLLITHFHELTVAKLLRLETIC